jgi:hypothetical protein
VYHGIYTVNQATEACDVLKVTLNPPNFKASRSFMG